MDYSITPKPADEVIANETDSLMKTTPSVPVQENSATVPDDKNPETVENQSNDNVVEIREVAEPSRFFVPSGSTSNEKVINAVVEDRHSVLKRERNEVMIQQQNIVNNGGLDLNGGITPQDLVALNNTLMRTYDESLMQTDLSRTNVYYTKKIFEEVEKMRKTLQYQSIVKISFSVVMVVLFIVSAIYSLEIIKGIMNGGLSDILTKMQGLNSLIPGSGGETSNLSGSLMKGLSTLLSGFGQGGGTVNAS